MQVWKEPMEGYKWGVDGLVAETRVGFYMPEVDLDFSFVVSFSWKQLQVAWHLNTQYEDYI